MPSQDPVPLSGVLGTPRPHSGGLLCISWDTPAGFGPSVRKHVESRQQPGPIRGPEGGCSHLLKSLPAEALHPRGHHLQPCLQASEPGQGSSQSREGSRRGPAPKPVPLEVTEPQSLPWLCPMNP